MASHRLLGLPSITPELKSITPYLQRADELKSQDPIMAYWCAYYAAQVGISLKAKDSPSRDVLFALLGTLERLKKDIGSNDAIDIEVASLAYVENFALKVFALADNEDRRGDPNRSTAKKFLAAANFLEVLKIFPKSDVSESNEEKIRYAKWKAADIAKAFREGRKPAPGPAGSGFPDPNLAPSPPASPERPAGTRRSSGSPPHIKRTSPPPRVDITRANLGPPEPPSRTPPRHIYLGVDVQGRPHKGWGGEGESTPGSWSTAATPGTAQGQPAYWEQVSPTQGRESGKERKRGHKQRSGSGSSAESGESAGGNGKKGVLKKNKAWVSEELDPHSANLFDINGNGAAPDVPSSAGTNSSDGSKKSVHFTPSVEGGLSSMAGSPPTSPSNESFAPAGEAWGLPASVSPPAWGGPSLPPQSIPLILPNTGVDIDMLPPGFVPGALSQPQNWTYPAPPFITPPSPPSSNMYQPPPQPQPPPNAPYSHSHVDSHAPHAPSPPQQNISAPQPVQPIYAPAPPSPPRAVELSPSVIAKAQKHCRFAISALDYEDAEQARKELRAALAALGG